MDILNSNSTSYSKSQRITALITLIVFFFQFPAWALASEISDADLQNQVNATTEFEESAVSRNLLIKAPYIGSVQEDKYPDLDDFFKRLKKDYPKVLGEPTYVPIAVSGITTVIPVYNQPKLVGDAFVQSRLIDAQIRAMLGKPLIDENQAYYKTQKLQIAKLYDNGYKRAQQSFIIDSLKYGNRLRTAPLFMGSLNHEDLIWPELREINGEMVLVPIVYLTESTIAKHKVTDHQTRFAGEATFADITIDGVKVRLDRNAFLNAVYDLTLVNGGEITGSYDVNVSAGGTLSLLESFITAGDDIKLSAHSVNAQTLVHRYDYGTKQQEYFGTITSVNSQNGNVIVRAYDDINIEGAHIYAGNGITFAADGRVYVGGVLATYTEAGREGKWKYSLSNVDYLASKLQAEEAIEIIAGSDIEIDSAEIVSSKGHIELLAGLGITIDNEFTSTNSHRHYKRSKKKRDVKDYETVAIRALLDAGKDVRIHSDAGDITLRATEINSSNGTTVTASRGGVNLLMAVETDHYRYYGKSKRTFSTRTIDRGHNIETPVYPTIVGGLYVDALYGLNVEYAGDSKLSLDEQLDNIAKLDGMSWISDVRDRDDINLHEVELAYETWDHDTTSLTPAAMAMITIAVAVAAGPAGTGAMGTISSAASSAFTVGSSAGAAAGAAAAAGFSAIVTQASISLASGNSIGDTLEQLVHEDSLRSVATSMVTAAAIASLDAAFFEPPKGTDGVVPPDSISQGNQAIQALVNAAASASVHTIINGGNLDSFLDHAVISLAQNSVNLIGEKVANQIGILADSNPPKIGEALRYISHAALGCSLGLASDAISETEGGSSNACASGAGGAVIGEAIAQGYSAAMMTEDQEMLVDWLKRKNIYSEDQLQNLSESQIAEYARLLATTKVSFNELNELTRSGVDLAKLGAGLGAFIAGGNVQIASYTGGNAAENNWFQLVILSVRAGMLVYSMIEVYQSTQEAIKAYQQYVNAPADQKDQILKDLAKTLLIDVTAGLTGTKLLKDIVDQAKRNGLDQKLTNVLDNFYENQVSGKPFNYGDRLDDQMVGQQEYMSYETRTGLKTFIDDNQIDLKDNWDKDRLFDEVLGAPKGERPLPETYLTAAQISKHLSFFDEGLVRITSAIAFERYKTLGPDNGFAMSKTQFDLIKNKAGGDLRLIERYLGLERDSLQDDDLLIAFIPPQNMPTIKIPSGNEVGANQYWLPGGVTSGGIREVVLDFSKKPEFIKLDLE